MGKSAPAPPDYEAAAVASAEASEQAMRDQTYANRIDQTNPWGQIGYDTYQDIDPASGQAVTRWRQTQTLTPEAQAALDSQMGVQMGRSQLAEGMLGDIGRDYADPMNFDAYGKPIGMGEQGRLGGAGEGIRTNFNAGRVGNVRTGFAFDDPGLQGQSLETSLDYSGAPDVNAPEWTRQAAEQSVYDRGASRLDPQIEQEQQALDVQLRSQGLMPGDEAYDAQMNSFNQRKTDAYSALQAQAMQEGARQAESMFGMESQYREQATGEEDRMKQFRNAALEGQFGIDAQRQAQLFDIAHSTGLFGQQGDMANVQAQAQQNALNLQAQGMGNQAQQQMFNQMREQLGYNTDQAYRENALANALRSQGMTEEMQQRGYRLNELNALLSGQQVNAPQFNNFAQQGAAQSADYLGAADMGYQARMGQFGADQASMNSLMGGIGQGVGMMGMFSDRRLKKNVHKLGKINGVNWYAYDYVWGEPGIGVMADEVPWASFETPSGYLAVDYRRI